MQKQFICKLYGGNNMINKTFLEKYKQSPKEATDYYYKLSQDSDYIRTYRIKKDIKWTVDTEYGVLNISINLSKPEKDPKEIALLKTLKSSNYPKCLLCKENEGYMGRINHPARQNHRIIPITINNSQWFLQYSPYVLKKSKATARCSVRLLCRQEYCQIPAEKNRRLPEYAFRFEP